jgi:hypothetical protein
MVFGWANFPQPDRVIYDIEGDSSLREGVQHRGSIGLLGSHLDQIMRLEKADAKWFAVLLLRSSIERYILTRAEVRDHITDGSFELSGDGDSK